jgi:filamentous hemagglutinin
MRVLGVTAEAFAAKNAYDAVKNNFSEAGGVNLNVSFGTSKNESHTTQTSDSASGSTVSAKNINIFIICYS